LSVTALRNEFERHIPNSAAIADALGELAHWIETDTSGAADDLCDDLAALFRMNLDREETRKRLVNLFRLLTNALDPEPRYRDPIIWGRN